MPRLIHKFPRQKVSIGTKTEAWALKCAQAAAKPILQNNQALRKSLKNKTANYKLRIGQIDLEDVEAISNPRKLKDDTFPQTFKHVGRGNSYLNLLIGEKLKRRIDFKVYLSSKDEEGISMKEDGMKQELVKKITEMVASKSQSEDHLKQELQKLESRMQYDYQDMREKVANKILRREVQRQNMKSKLAGTFEDALICGEELIYMTVTGRELYVEKVNPLNFYSMGSGYSDEIEQHDIIVYYDFMSTGQVIDRYYEDLKPHHIDDLESGEASRTGEENPYGPIDNNLIQGGGNGALPGGVRIITPSAASHYGNYLDGDGNILVTHVNWRSRKKVGELHYLDPMDGAELTMLVPEGYEPVEQLGETVTWYWVNEWWQATLIKNDILVNWGPIPFQSRSPHQLSEGCPNFIGQYYNVNQGQVHSLMDVIKPLDYSYDLAFWKREKEMAANFGTLTFYNSALVPNGWKADKWMAFGMESKLLPMNPTQEITKGAHTGKPAGFQQQKMVEAISSQAYNDIRMYTEVMLALEDQMAKITGISPQREAQVTPSETATGTQVAYQQSSAITEPLFNKQANFEQRVLTLLLEKSKYLYSRYPQVGQFVFDEIGLEIVKNFDEIAERHMDVHVHNSGKEQELEKIFIDLAHAAMQNGQASLNDIASIYLGDSLQHTIRKLDISSERIAQERDAHEKELQQMQIDNEEKARLYQEWFDTEKIRLEDRKLDILAAQAEDKAGDSNRNWIKDEVEMDMKILEIEQKDRDTDKKLKSDDKLNLRDNETKVKIEKMKPTPKPAAAKKSVKK